MRFLQADFRLGNNFRLGRHPPTSLAQRWQSPRVGRSAVAVQQLTPDAIAGYLESSWLSAPKSSYAEWAGRLA
jgi:hypothetical protein